MDIKTYTFEELCEISGVSSRTVRYYIQIGLLDKPIGQTRAAHYVSLHLEKILRIKQLTEAGISLERIREVLSGEPMPLPERPKQPGQIEVLKFNPFDISNLNEFIESSEIVINCIGVLFEKKNQKFDQRRY